jgi:hypothetical protein
MTSLLDALSQINRPRLLIRAARFGLEDYNRNRDLKRILRGDSIQAPSSVLPRLMDLEAAQEDTRRRGDAAYSVSSHLEILIAIMAEARLIGGGTSQA